MIGLKYRDGVLLMSDTAANYGSMSMFRDIKRLNQINDNTMIAASGEISDFQYLCDMLNRLTTEDFCYADGAQLTPQEIHSYVARVCYNKRSKVDPLWNMVITGGYDAKKNESFLGIVDLYGSNHTGDYFATGYGQELAIPIIRKYHRMDMTYEEAKALLEDCFRILYYRHARALNSYILGSITKDGCKISEPFTLPTNWEFKRFVNPDDSS